MNFFFKSSDYFLSILIKKAAETGSLMKTDLEANSGKLTPVKPTKGPVTPDAEGGPVCSQ